MSQDLKERLILFFQSCNSFKGKRIQVKEHISTNKDNYDRHFASFSKMEFQLIDFGIRISGARAMFIGETQSYEIGADMLIKFEQQENDMYELVEKYSENVFRKSTLTFL